MQTNTLPEIARLTDLASTIRSTHEAAIKLAEQTKKKGNEAIAEALLCGDALNEAKKLVPHGQWIAWLTEHCPDVAPRTAQRYMQLASNTSRGTHLDDVVSLRQLYNAVGIRDDSKPCTKNKPEPAEAPKTTSQPVTPTHEEEPVFEIAPIEADEQEAFEAGEQSQSAPSQQTFQSVDPLAHLRKLVTGVMAEVAALGVGMKSGVGQELAPIFDWGRQEGLV